MFSCNVFGFCQITFTKKLENYSGDSFFSGIKSLSLAPSHRSRSPSFCVCRCIAFGTSVGCFPLRPALHKKWSFPLRISSISLEGIFSKFLKDGAEVLALPPCNPGKFVYKAIFIPDQCKIAKLKSLFKKGSKNDPKNYRPIWLLCLK